ncbi:MAG TPA: hypothetical protein VL084_00890 [Thermoanaerobaculia bacterium]|nr:hypothetical protein [Thermoanaerobaculia bacterium]
MLAEPSALDDLILGRGVKRGRHELPPEVFPLFRERLVACGFVPTVVGAVEIEVGVRVPAWLLHPPLADFGTVFWEIFTPIKRRKLFGSVIRNRKGDWAIQLAPGSEQTIWVSDALAEHYDASRPVGMW